MKQHLTAQSPGRINIIGEHTDYNDGFVLPAAIDKKTITKITLNGSENKIRVKALNVGEEYSFNLGNFSPIKGGWENYIMGVVSELQKIGASFIGMDIEFEGDVPIGSGMSSSAALECSLAFGLNELFQLGFDKWQLIKASQMAEHNFVGIKCGIMDQFASVMGKKGHVMLLDCRSLEFNYFPFDLGDYQLVLLNTKVSHSLASSEYNTRRSECEEGVAIIKHSLPDIKNLRDVKLHWLEENQDLFAPKIFDRCHHVVAENDRVLKTTEALNKKDFKRVGSLVYASHDSLQNKYEVSCPELDFLVEYHKENDKVLGSRMMGGGFGGCTINIVKKNHINQFIDSSTSAYKNEFKIDLEPYLISIEDGAKEV